jgi:alanine dehydrogenase
MPPTLVLTRADVAALLPDDACAAAVADALRAEAEGRALPAAVLAVSSRDGTLHAKAGSLTSPRPLLAVKANANFPGSPARFSLPTIQGVVALFDGTSGALLALIESGELTARRTAGATAVAARLLALPDADTVTICGCGVQARAQLRALRSVLPLRSAFAYDVDAARAERFASETSDASLSVTAVRELGPAARASRVVVTATTARAPFLGPGDVAPGTFVAAVGGDSPEKTELEPALLGTSAVIVDSLAQCAAFGELSHAVAAGTLREDGVRGTLGQVLAGLRPGRLVPEEVVVFDSTGTALEDVAAAALVEEGARRAGRGISIEFG